MAPLAGWYPDPTGAAAYRFWDGRQWTAALAAPMVVPIGAPPEPKDWCQRHPAWTTLIAFWVACMVWQWAWLAPLLAVFSEQRLHRLQAGPYASRSQAQAAAQRLRDQLQLVPAVVERR